jgi:hypothetical protein
MAIFRTWQQPFPAYDGGCIDLESDLASDSKVMKCAAEGALGA